MPRRIAVRTVKYLLVGTVMAFLVAMRFTYLRSNLEDVDSTDDAWAASLVAQHPQLNIDGPVPHHILRAPGATRCAVMVERGDEYVYIIGQRVGWPFRCLDWSIGREFDAQTLSYRSRRFVRAFTIYDDGRGRGVVVPYGLRPFGMLLNSVFYGSLAAIALAAVRHWRRRSRTDRGLCPRCAYNLAGAPRRDVILCSECGYLIPTKCFARRRQVLRWWMVPFAIPPLYLLILMGIGGTDWQWLHFNLGYATPLLTGFNAAIVALTALWLWFIAESAFQDRPTIQRALISAVVAIVATVPCFVSLCALVAWYSRTS